MLARASFRIPSRATRQLHTRPQTIASSPLSPRLAPRPIIQPQLVRTQQRRCRVTLAEGFRNQYRKSPFLFPLALFTVVFGFGTLFIYSPYVYAKYIIGEFSAFPEPVANKLRRALYFTNHNPDPERAVKYYRQALAIADEMGLDPFSNEMLGVKIQVSAFYEKMQQYQAAIQVLEIVRRDCLAWVEKLGEKHHEDGKRTRVLQKTVGISLKLGELYAGEHVQDKEAAEQQFIWAVETVLAEKKRRDIEGVKEGEGDWVSDEEFGNALVSLAQNYEAKDLHYLATPLFVRAFTLLPQRTCESVVLMNNIATSIAQQSPPPSTLPPRTSTSPVPPTRHTKPSRLPSQTPLALAATKTGPPSETTATSSFFPSSPGPSRSTLLAQSKLWAEKALALSKSIAGPARTQDCDVGCAVATHNLGEFAEMLGDTQEAARRYEEARNLAREIGFQEGVTNAEQGLARVRAAA